jgi:leucyl-tRNA synthetase
MIEKNSNQYPFAEIEAKWRKIWREKGLYKTDFNKTGKKLYCLVMFPYPSGDKMHIGQWYNYGPTDTWARLKRMQGYNVFFPMGYDAFGLPAENFAIKHKVHPAVSTKANIEYFKKQLEQIGSMINWESEVVTCQPDYYKWTQWVFLKLYEKGLAYRKEAPVNWCPSCKTVLANEQAIDGLCERCGSDITRKNLTQWFFKITAYAERLLAGHEKLDWPSKTILMQKNWIGRSEGSEIVFKEADSGQSISVFTTRADTLFGVTYMVLAPEHPLVENITTANQKEAVAAYQDQARKSSEIDRLSAVREKTGVFTGSYAINPINGDKIPIWIADYVLATYGTGAVMAVPGHDERDWEFATKYKLPIKTVIVPTDQKEIDLTKCAFVEYGQLTNSGEFNGVSSENAIKQITAELEKAGLGKATISYRFRDWLISRQRYWGAPIPIVFCPKCGEVAVPEKDLPILLPEITDFRPTETGESPLARSDEFVNINCPKCGGPAKRSTETMDTFVDSSWYFLRYVNPHFDKGPWDNDRVNQWLPVDFYVGGAEHAVMHLMYARFVNMCLHDLGLIHFDEPFVRLRHQGIITSKGAKISKSKGNVINPDSFIESFGSDTFRVYLMFMGSYVDGGDWDDSGINGAARFIGRVYRLIDKHLGDIKPMTKKAYADINTVDKELKYYLNHTIQKVGRDIDSLDYNTAVAALMEFLNQLYNRSDSGNISDLFKYSLIKYIQLLAPLAPHLAEELWSRLGYTESVFDSGWPQFDQSALEMETVTIAVQISGKLRGTFDVAKDISKEDLLKLVKSDERVARHLEGKQIIKEIIVPGKLVNIVTK